MVCRRLSSSCGTRWMSFKREKHSNIPLERRGFGDERMSRATNDIGDLSQRGLSACAHFTPSFP